MKITDKERAALIGIRDCEYQDSCAGSTAVVGNYVWSFAANPFGDKKSFGGVVASLSKKGLVKVDDNGDPQGECIALTAEGYALVPFEVAETTEAHGQDRAAAKDELPPMTLRNKWEDGTTVVSYVAAATEAFTVVTAPAQGRFNVYRYFKLGADWQVSQDHNHAPVETAMLYLLNHPAK